MAQGQYYPGAELIESPVVFSGSVTLAGGMLAGVPTSPPAVAAGAGAGVGATITQRTGSDFAGSFVVTAAGTPAAGTLATVTYGNALGATPSSVLVSASDDGAKLALSAGAGSITNLGFAVLAPATTATHTYKVTYVVIQ